MRIDALKLVGVMVNDLDAAVEKYSALFGLDFLTFTAGVDYELSSWTAKESGTVPLRSGARLAVDTSDTFELVEMPGVSEGIRNVHFRVDDMDAAIAQFAAWGVHPSQGYTAGTAREVVFDAADMNGVRLCLLQYEGPAFAEALATSPRP